MRTTLDIDDDVLSAAKEMAQHERTTAGQVISRVFRRAFQRQSERADEPNELGFRPFRSRGVLVTNEQVNAIREAEGI